MAEPTVPDIAVVAPTYRRPDRARRLLDALERQTLDAGRFEVVVVDDCSPGDAAHAVERHVGQSRLRARLLRNPRNTGPAAARNLGWRATDAAHVAFVDDDCVPEPGWLAALLGALEADPDTGVVQGRTERQADVPLGDWTLFREVRGPTPFFEGCNIAYRRAALEATGGFDERFGLGWEDTAAGWKVVDAGWRRAFADEAVVVHDVEERGLRWHLRDAWKERRMVTLARRHPGFRAAACWRPWAFRKENATVTVAWLGLLLGLRWRPALVLAYPWYRWRRPPRGHHRHLALTLERFAVDSAQAAALLAGSARERTVVL